MAESFVNGGEALLFALVDDSVNVVDVFVGTVQVETGGDRTITDVAEVCVVVWNQSGVTILPQMLIGLPGIRLPRVVM